VSQKHLIRFLNENEMRYRIILNHDFETPGAIDSKLKRVYFAEAKKNIFSKWKRIGGSFSSDYDASRAIDYCMREDNIKMFSKIIPYREENLQTSEYPNHTEKKIIPDVHDVKLETFIP